MLIVRRQLASSDIVSPSYRWNPETDTIEFTPDNGETWREAPEFDPRNNPVYQLPPLTGDDVKCRAAQGARAAVELIVNKRIEQANGIGLASGILGIITLFMKNVTFLQELILSVAGVLASLDVELLTEAFDAEGYETVVCAFYENMNADGTLSFSRLDDVINACSPLGFVGQTVIAQIALLLGVIGLNNGAIYYENGANCDACGWCYTIDLTASDGGFSLYGAGQGAYVSGSGWECRGLVLGGTNRMLAQITRSFSSTTLRRVTIAYDYTAGTQQSGAEAVSIFVNNAVRATIGQPMASVTNARLEWNGEIAMATSVILTLQPGFGAQNGSGRIFGVTFQGDGVNPFGVDNC